MIASVAKNQRRSGPVMVEDSAAAWSLRHLRAVSATENPKHGATSPTHSTSFVTERGWLSAGREAMRQSMVRTLASRTSDRVGRDTRDIIIPPVVVYHAIPD